ncbi:MAG: response regulator, partial [Bacteroidota bacterium]
RESEEKFKYLADFLPQTVFECDIEGNLSYVNSRGLKQFGYSQEDFLKGINIFQTVVSKDIELLKNNFEKFIAEEQYYSVEYNAKRKDGSIFPIMVYPNLIKTNDKVTGLRGIIIDTSNQKRIQEELIVAKEAAEAANRAKSMFLTNISHELRTPMNSIFGMTELIKKTNLSDKQYDFLKIITESSENLLSFINDIIIIPQIESEQLIVDHKPFKLQDLLASVVGMLSYQAEIKKIRLIETQKFDNDCVVYGDPVRLNQILIDLVELFLKYTAEKGEIEICISGKNKQANLCDIDFIIKKSGTNLPKQMLKELKADFSNAHVDVYNKYGSHGLGLIIADQLIKILGSELLIDTKGKETIFKFNLNLISGLMSDLDKYKKTKDIFESDELRYLKNLKILLVEDEIFNQLVIEALVEEWDCEIDVAENGKEAFEKLDKRIYDVILMDIVLPGMSGIEITKKIRKKYSDDKKNIPIVAISADLNASTQPEFVDSGIDYFIAKPFKSKELFHVLVKCLVNKDNNNDSGSNRIIEKRDLKELYNLKIIENIAKNNKVLIIKMIRVFLDKARDEVKFLKIYAQNNDFESIKKMIHKMKPAISYMGINFIFSDLEQIQIYVNNESNPEEIKKIVTDIDFKMNEVFALLEDEIVSYS